MSHRDVTIGYGAIYTVMVAGDDGNPTGEGENITFEIMGKKAIVETSKHGIAGVYLPLEVNNI